MRVFRRQAAAGAEIAAMNRVFSRSQLLDGIWGRDSEIDERTVDVHIGRLRKALRRAGRRDPIRTVRGAGYAFDETYGTSASDNNPP